jgi:hypothetical protein
MGGTSNPLRSILGIPTRRRTYLSTNSLFCMGNKRKSKKISGSKGNKLIVPAECTSLIGSCANIEWRSVSCSELRQHPFYRKLPLPSDVAIKSSKSLALFRQDSWQWNALHVGRMTTSKISSCLGFFEGFAAKVLDIPRSLRGHERALSAWHHLKQKSPHDWSFLVNSNTDYVASDSTVPDLWLQAPPGEYFPFKLNTSVIEDQDFSTKQSYKDVMGARLAWGSCQEATAVLAALNYFSQRNPGTLVLECGMFPLEALDECPEHRAYLEQARVLRDILGGAAGTSTATGSSSSINSTCGGLDDAPSLYAALQHWSRIEGSLPPVGASPDGLIRHADGSLEVLEVKCQSPFVSFRGGDNNGGGGRGNLTVDFGRSITGGSAALPAVPTAAATPAATIPPTPPTPPLTSVHTKELQDPLSPADTGSSSTGTGSGPSSGPNSGPSSGPSSARVREKHAGIPVWHVPQLQTEMLCVGAHCRSAVMLVLTVTGARIYRMQRDDEVRAL